MARLGRAADYDTDVVGSSGGCKGRVMAASLGSASILLQGPAGVFALPAGFASSGVVIAGSAAGSAARGRRCGNGIACTNGARTGSMTAIGSNGAYSGTFAFGPSTGQISVTR